jgi:hypothetical protein
MSRYLRARLPGFFNQLLTSAHSITVCVFFLAEGIMVEPKASQARAAHTARHCIPEHNPCPEQQHRWNVEREVWSKKRHNIDVAHHDGKLCRHIMQCWIHLNWRQTLLFLPMQHLCCLDLCSFVHKSIKEPKQWRYNAHQQKCVQSDCVAVGGTRIQFIQ